MLLPYDRASLEFLCSTFVSGMLRDKKCHYFFDHGDAVS